MERTPRLSFKKRCEFCDKEFISFRKHSRTCSMDCRGALYRKGFTNEMIMNLYATFPSPPNPKLVEKLFPKGAYNLCVEKSGMTYIYKYTDEYLKAKKDKFQKVPLLKELLENIRKKNNIK